MHLQFRKGLEQDRQALFDLLQDNQMEPEVDPGEFLLAISEDKLAGAIRVECEEQALYLRPLVVASDFQGKGIGRALVHELSKTHAVLHVVARGSAVEFYRHIGFTAIDWGQVPERYRQECELCTDRSECAPLSMRFMKVDVMTELQELLDRSAARHSHLCPRQVLGVRMGMLAGKLLQLDLPQTDKRLFVIAECDGCGTGGIEVATGCSVDHRTFRVVDYGKLAATFVDTQTGQAIRIRPQHTSRVSSEHYAAAGAATWDNQLQAYQTMPDVELFTVQPVELTISLEKIISKPGLRINCEKCGEEITNEREIIVGGSVFCRSCIGDSYYQTPERKPAGPIPVITVIGKSGSGKTTLLEKLVRELTARGYRLATVKHHSHSNFEIDVRGKDSWRFAQAGSEQVVISAPEKLAYYRKLEHEVSLDEITQGIRGVDLILVEGYKNANKPTIEVIRTSVSQTLIGDQRQTIAIVSDTPRDTQVPFFDQDDFMGIAGLIEKQFLLGR